ncbi:MAG TPA: PBP1A family penicillin-binding protein [Acidobacteriaceae bacterium]|nr:PBP1A family penicillin-binding protein [Acidobacteriaceae bacterium]
MPSLLQPERKAKRGVVLRIKTGPRSPVWGAMLRFPFGDPADPQSPLARRAAFLLLLTTSAVFGVMIGLLLMYAINLPQMTELEHYRPSTTTELYDVHGKIFGSFASERRVVVPYSEIPPVLREAILSIEDKNFFQNGGVNLVRVVGAAYEDYRSHGKAQGASTLTMQLARNLFLSSEKTYGRKLQEIFLTLQMERHFTKDQIFGLYANQIYLGRGTYGFEAGSEYYFSKHLRQLTLPEAALLAALPKGPEYYSPVRYPERALKRRNLVIEEMLRDGKISSSTAAAAEATPLVLHIETPPNTEAPYFVEEVRRQLEHEYGVDEVHGSGLRVYTTLDLDMQHAAEKATLDGLAAYERRHGWKGKLPTITNTAYDPGTYKHPDWSSTLINGAYVHALVTQVSPAKMTVRIGRMQGTMTPPDWAWTQKYKATELASPGDIVYVHVLGGADTGPLRLALEQDSGAQSSLMAVDNATGEVLAMIGGRDFALSQFNRATQSQRQVGSSFKIYDYTAAFEAGSKPYDAISDAATTFYTASGPYSPHDYEAGFAGTMTMIDAFAQSRNIPALRIADRVGIKKVIEVARRFGVTSPMPNYLPVAIGAADLTLSEQVASYSVFPNDGIRIAPHYIKRVTQADGTPIEVQAPAVREVISVEIARKMMLLLQAVTSHGTAATASELHHAIGGKTGTTNNYTDAWFLGFSPSITCGTWVGYDTRQSLGEKETGARAALPIWIDFMKTALADRPSEQFPRANAPKRQLEVAVNSADDTDKADADGDSDDPASKTDASPALSAPTTDAVPNDAPPAGGTVPTPVPVSPQALNPSAAPTVPRSPSSVAPGVAAPRAARPVVVPSPQ